MELMVVELSRQLRNGELVMTGASSRIPVAAALLAQLRQAPDLTLILPSGAVNPSPGRLYQSASDGRWCRSCEAFGTAYDLFELSENGRLDVIFYGGVEVDRFGNVNLTQVPDRSEPGSPPGFRGPGLANISFAVTARRVLLYSAQHSRRTFVSRVSYLTAPGHLSGGAAGRRAVGIDTAGPQYCITPLATLAPDPDSKALRLRSIHPGVDVDQVQAATGFDVGSTDQVTAAPTREELDCLRSAVDRDGTLRQARAG
jgi:glutaconate CoA-transferase, subunit B